MWVDLSKIKVDWFEIVYIAISIATFKHTTWAGSMIFEGGKPEGDAIGWWFSGALFAIAIDIGMFVVARKLKKFFDPIYLGAFIFVAVMSAYAQVIYVLHHTEPITFSDGVSHYWIDAINPFLEARVIIMPVLLPGLAILYTMSAAISRNRERLAEIVEQEHEQMLNAPYVPQIEVQSADGTRKLLVANTGDAPLGYTCLICDRSFGPYKDEDARKKMVKGHFKRYHSRERSNEEKMWEAVTLHGIAAKLGEVVDAE